MSKLQVASVGMEEKDAVCVEGIVVRGRKGKCKGGWKGERERTGRCEQ